MRLKYPTTRFVFDRKKQATKTKAALIQVEVLFERKKKYITTGVKVFKGQFDTARLVHSRLDMLECNERITAIKMRIDDWLNSVMQRGAAFEWAALDNFIDNATHTERTFVDFAEEMIATRADIRETTRKTQRKLITALAEFGRITAFADITRANIMAFDDYLHARGIRQTTIYSYHKFLKTYINAAIRRELLETNPYAAISIKRGESVEGRFLTEEELNAVSAAPMPTESLTHVRDLFVLQCLTGLSYSDLMNFDFSQVKTRGEQKVFSGKRNKTGVSFTFALLPAAQRIIERYNGTLPKLTNQQYNMRLKLVAQAAGIEKPIASHWGRRTCGMYLLNNGFSMEVVAKVLGHSSIRTTEAIYAKILDRSVEDAFSQLAKKKGEQG